MFATPITALNYGGYMIAFIGICVYNFRKFKDAAAHNAALGTGAGGISGGKEGASPALPRP